jgi:diguanylate cyclase (GGDEF)-like protein
MHRPEQPLVSFAATAIGVASAPDLDAAYDVVRGDLFQQLLVHASVLEWTGTRWTVRTETAGESPISRLVDSTNCTGGCMTDFAVHPIGLDEVTIVPVTGVDDPRVVLAIEGDWSYLRDALMAGVPLLGLALQLVRERAARTETARLVVDVYARIRRLSQLRTQDDLARYVVREAAELLRAERVTLALYREDEQCLRIVATAGLSLEAVKTVRIVPGEWVIGHVYASKRPVFVRDVGRLPGFSANDTRYRTTSFAAVPILTGSEAAGVITVTDKCGSEAFTRGDELVLRALSAAVGIAMVAARAGDAVTRLEYEATIDSLTGLLNRPGFDSRLHQELERARRESGQLAVLMADVDDFKTVNDTRGHQVGDAMLKHVGSVIRSSVRVFDLCARFGGDEFAVVMPNSDRDSAILCAERIRRRLAERSGDRELPELSISIGVAVAEPGDTAGALVSRADQCLYRAKADGKNLVRAHPAQMFELPAPLASAVDRAGEPKGESSQAGNEAIDPAHESAGLRYVLAIDSQAERASFCLQCVAPFRAGFLLARDAAQAAGIIDRFGPPLLLIVDLEPGNDGFELIERARDRHGDGSAVIAWSASRDMREYAGARLTRRGVHVIAGSASQSTIKGAINRCLDRRAEAAPEKAVAALPSWSAEQLQRVMAELAYRIQHLISTPGVAVYLRGPRERSYRASFSWNSDSVMPHSSAHIPRAFQEVTSTGRSVVARDLQPHVDDVSQSDGVRGLAAVPVRAGAEVLGALCVFDVQPLSVTDAQVAALEALGRTVVEEVELQVSSERPQPKPAEVIVSQDRPVATVAARTADWPPALLERVGGEFAVAREMARARREGKEMSVILFEIAPLTADADLEESVQHASETLLRTIRQSDLPIRWSGREFLVVLPGLAGNGARMVAERVRAALQAGARHRVAVAGGVAEFDDEEVFGEVVSKARERVGLARGSGHNRIQ